MERGRLLFKVYFLLVAFSILGSAASVMFHLNPGPIAPAAGFLVVLTGALCIGSTVGKWSRVGLLLGFSALAEMIGLFTGLPFGRYEYTSAWWPVVPLGEHFFPLLLPFAWLMIVGGSWISLRTCMKGWLAIIWTGVLAALIDAPMERVMTDVFGYWKWAERGPVFGAPILNTVGWFLVGAIGAAIVEKGSDFKGSRHGWWVIGPFCIFAAIFGFLRFFDWAFVILLILGLLFSTLTVGRKSWDEAARQDPEPHI